MPLMKYNSNKNLRHIPISFAKLLSSNIQHPSIGRSRIQERLPPKKSFRGKPNVLGVREKAPAAFCKKALCGH
nr:hypothetical protein [Tanacetum cinerariifolium]